MGGWKKKNHWSNDFLKSHWRTFLNVIFSVRNQKPVCGPTGRWRLNTGQSLRFKNFEYKNCQEYKVAETKIMMIIIIKTSFQWIFSLGSSLFQWNSKFHWKKIIFSVIAQVSQLSTTYVGPPKEFLVGHADPKLGELSMKPMYSSQTRRFSRHSIFPTSRQDVWSRLAHVHGPRSRNAALLFRCSSTLAARDVPAAFPPDLKPRFRPGHVLPVRKQMNVILEIIEHGVGESLVVSVTERPPLLCSRRERSQYRRDRVDQGCFAGQNFHGQL